MKVIDLLNKIANGEQPNKIKYQNTIYFKSGMNYVNIDECLPIVFMQHIFENSLNDEVEIIEEDKKIEKVNTYVLCDYDFKSKDDDNNLIATNIIDRAFEEYSHKINEIIDKLNEMEKE